MTHILVIVVGGTNIKVGAAQRESSRWKIPSGRKMRAAGMAAEVLKAIEGWKYDAVSIGYPGAVKGVRPAHEPITWVAAGCVSTMRRRSARR